MSTPARCIGRTLRTLVSVAALAGAACGPAATQAPPAAATPRVIAPAEEEKAIAEVLDDWHAAAARADEERYFGYMTEDSVFLGTDATERWDKKAFRAYAHPHFFNGKAWAFHATRRAIVIAPGGESAWFDEDLATEKLGPARGSGALVKQADGWRIALYNLSIPIPNERFDAVRKIIAGEDASVEPKAPSLAEVCASAAPGTVCGVVDFTGTVPEMRVPRQRADAEFCKGEPVIHNAVLVQRGRLQDVAILVVTGLPAAKAVAPAATGKPAGTGKTPAPAAKSPGSVDIHQSKCNYVPRVSVGQLGQTVRIFNDDATLHNVHAYDEAGASWFNQAQPKGSEAVEQDLTREGIVRFSDDVHPWMTGFLVVTSHPYAAVTPASGAFSIKDLPPGKYGIEAWHSIYGAKRATVTVKSDAATTVSFSYDGKESFPKENPRAAEDVKSFR